MFTWVETPCVGRGWMEDGMKYFPSIFADIKVRQMSETASLAELLWFLLNSCPRGPRRIPSMSASVRAKNPALSFIPGS